MALRGWWILLVALTAGARAAAQPLPPDELPEPLRPWAQWVLDGTPGAGCVAVGGQPVCAWPGRLQLDLRSAGGTFRLDVALDREADVPLPGDAQRWPQGVVAGSRAVPVIEKDELPWVRLAAGTHRLEGRFAWPRLPDVLAVPASVALVDVSIGGRAVPSPRRDAAGVVWLRAEGAGPAVAGETLRLQLFRKVVDGIPLQVETVMQMEVSGKAREVELAGVLLPGSTPLAVRGGVPARVDGDGRLRVQVRAGRHQVSVLARLPGRGETVEAPPTAVGGVDREVWVFQANEALRQVEVAGAPSIDPSRTDLPEGWRTLPAFVLAPGGRLTLKEVRRGQPEAPPDALRLSRELWLDFDGGGYTVRDTFAGEAHRTTRLDLQAPGELGRASIDGQDQLVTANPQTGAHGIEVRRVPLKVVADARLPRSGTSPAVGWSTSVEQLRAVVHVPPGWSLLAATGVDNAPGAWTERWTLLGFFFVLIVALAVARLFGRGAGALALAAMVLSYGEPDAPGFVWLVLVGAVALRRVAPGGWLGSIARVAFLASAGIVAVMFVGFASRQVQEALFPQVGGAHSSGFAGRGMTTAMQDMAPAAPPVASEAPSDEEADKLKALGDASNTGGRQRQAPYLALNKALEQDPHAVLQTGPGVPSWTWRSYTLGWSGPVSREQPLRLVLVSPWANRLLTVVRLALLAAFGALLLGWRPRRLPEAPAPPVESAPAIVLLALLLAAPASAQENPTPELLEEMKTRLTRPPVCAPDCVTTADLTLRISGETLVIAAEVHAQADTSWPIPGPSGSWVPSEIRVDGASHAAVARRADGFLHVRLRAGVHRLELSGPAPVEDSLTLQLPERPHRARAEAPDWEVIGLRESGPSEGSIQLTRRLVRTGSSHAEGVYPPWLEVERTIEAGVSWRATTRVRRVSPSTAPVAVRIPLLPGESLTEGGYEVENGEVVLSLAAEQQEAGWSSAMEPRTTLTLAAPSGRPWSEVWRLQCGVVWQCTFAGLVPVVREREQIHEPEFRPWPGEMLELRFAHPAGVPGQTLTIDDVKLEAAPGARLEKTTLSLSVRASRDDALTLALPADAEVQTLTVDGTSRPVRVEGGRARVSVPVGTHAVALTWHRAQGMGLHYRLPSVDLGRPAVNVAVTVRVPDDRWLLFVHGPAWGPAILFWAWLLVVMAVAMALGRVPHSPLKAREWLLLGLGLTQVPGVAAALAAGFFLALAWRCRQPRAGALAHDVLQLVLAAWALVTIGVLYGAIHSGLLLRPDMEVAGNGSSGSLLRWTADRIAGVTPAAGVISLPLWLYRVAMLAWALWLASSLVRWTAWAWTCFNEGGLWRPLTRRAPVPAAPLPDEGRAAKPEDPAAPA